MNNLIDQLPMTLKTIVDLTDIDSAMALVNRYGGTSFHIPPLRMMNPTHEIARLIGLDHGIALCRYYSGDTIYLPRASHYLQAIRDEKIRADAKTLSTTELAFKYKMSERWVRKIKNSGTQERVMDDRQLGLF